MNLHAIPLFLLTALAALLATLIKVAIWYVFGRSMKLFVMYVDMLILTLVLFVLIQARGLFGAYGGFEMFHLTILYVSALFLFNRWLIKE